ncbi:MAG TPA: nucleoside hydrolase-like domain-containing protein, partial [Polyangia bacterium]
MSEHEGHVPVTTDLAWAQRRLVFAAFVVASVATGCGVREASPAASDAMAGEAHDAADAGVVDSGAGDARFPTEVSGPTDGADAAVSAPRARVVIETSATPGEVQALGRLLFYADEIDIAGIVVTDAGAEASARIEALLSAYAATRPALQRFADQPEVADLRARVVVSADVASAATAATALTTAGAPTALGPSRLYWLAFAPRPRALRWALDHLAATERPDVTQARLARLHVHGFDTEETLGPHTGALAQIRDYGPRDDADRRGGPIWSDLTMVSVSPAVSLAAAGSLGAHLAELAATDSAGAPGAWLMVLPLFAGSPTVTSEPGWGGWGGRFVPAPSGLPNVFVPAPNDIYQDLRGTLASVARFAAAAIFETRA